MPDTDAHASVNLARDAAPPRGACVVRNRASAFGDGTRCAVHLRQRLGQSEMADIRAYRAENAASGPGMYRDATGTWVVDDSIRLEDGGSANDAIVL